MTEYEQMVADLLARNPDADHVDRAKVVDCMVEKLKAQPGVEVITEMAPTRFFKQKWQRRGCETRVKRTDDGTYAIYAWWPLP